MKYVYEFMSLCFALSEMCFALTVRHGVFGSIFIDYTVSILFNASSLFIILCFRLIIIHF